MVARIVAMKSATAREEWRRAWDLNPRNFRLPVFKTGALGRYASPPWANLPCQAARLKTELSGKFEQLLDDDGNAFLVVSISYELGMQWAILMSI